MASVRKLSATALYRRCDLKHIPYRTTEDLEVRPTLVGQPRADVALRMAAEMARPGMNVFAVGAPGTGKRTWVLRTLSERATQREAPPDQCYVHNFADPRRPQLLRLPPGLGVALRRDMAQLVRELPRALIPGSAGEGRPSRSEAHPVLGSVVPAEGRSSAEGLTLLDTNSPTRSARDSGVMATGEFSGAAYREMGGGGAGAAPTRTRASWGRVSRASRRSASQRSAPREDETGGAGLFTRLYEAYRAHPAVLGFLDAVQTDVMAHREQFAARSTAGSDSSNGHPPVPGDSMSRYDVNVVVDSSAATGAPVVYEDNPTYQNLFGGVENGVSNGAAKAVGAVDHMHIRGGAFHRAQGGYLVVEGPALTQDPAAWRAVKRALRSRRIRIESTSAKTSTLASGPTLEPEPVPLELQVVILGPAKLYDDLCDNDEEVSDLFEVVAEFDDRMPSAQTDRRRYAELIATLVRQEGLRPFDRAGVARVLEHSARLVEDQERLTARIGQIVSLLREADYWAGGGGAELASAEHVQQAIEAQAFRVDRVRERYLEEILRGSIDIDTTGRAIGQVNGLAVGSFGTFTYGHPSRITARARLGEGDVLDIEREIDLGGPIHSKGVLILQGYLGAHYAPDRPLSLAASIVFEQTYTGIEGDSASVAELVALLSAIAEVPVKQSLALTGAIDQRGRIQTVGGINEKIEGFFDVCRARGLTGQQGVVIPAANTESLMLQPDLVDAVADGRFHIYPVTTVDQVLELLSGMPAGRRNSSGRFPARSFNRRVEARLIELAEERKAFKGTPEEDEDG